MTHTIDAASYDAFVHLMAQSDPCDLPRRAHTRRCDGDPNRRTTRLPGILGMAAALYLERDIDEPIAPATRRTKWQARPNPELRVLRGAA